MVQWCQSIVSIFSKNVGCVVVVAELTNTQILDQASVAVSSLHVTKMLTALEEFLTARALTRSCLVSMIDAAESPVVKDCLIEALTALNQMLPLDFADLLRVKTEGLHVAVKSAAINAGVNLG